MSKRDRDRREEYASATAAAEGRSTGNFTCLSIPDGMKLFKPKKGKVTLDFVPYRVGEGNPWAKKGEKYYERTYWVHGFCIGPNNESHICLAKTYGKKCPGCEKYEASKIDPNFDEETRKKLRAKQRQLFLVIDREASPDEVQLFDCSFSTFGKKLDEAVNDPDHKGSMKDFFRADAEGKSVRCGFSEESGGKFTFIECSSIVFKDRGKSLSKDLLRDLPCLDDLLKPLSYKAFQELMEGGGGSDDDEDDDDEDDKDDDTDTDDDDDDDEPPRKKSKSKKSRDDDDEDDDDDDPPPKSSKKNKSKDDDEDDDTDTDDDEPPRKKKSSKKKSKDDDDDEDDDDSDIPFDDDDDEDDDD